MKQKGKKYKIVFFGNDGMIFMINKRFADIGSAFAWCDEYKDTHDYDRYSLYLQLTKRRRKNEW